MGNRIRIPTSFTALKATGNGNCLYNSVSILLYGDEEQAVLLRLASVEYAITHFKHYMETVSSKQLCVRCTLLVAYKCT